MSFANEIKRIRDKTFCFDTWLRPNPCTRHTSHIHGAGCSSRELRGIRMFEVPPLLLGKWATTFAIPEFVLPLASKWWVTKKKKENKHGWTYELTQQTTKWYSLCGVCLRLFASNFFGWLAPVIFFASFSTYFGEALVSGWPWSLSLSPSLPFCYRAYMFNSWRICKWVALIVRSTRGGENLLRSKGGIFCLLLGDEKLAKK